MADMPDSTSSRSPREIAAAILAFPIYKVESPRQEERGTVRENLRTAIEYAKKNIARDIETFYGETHPTVKIMHSVAAYEALLAGLIALEKGQDITPRQKLAIQRAPTLIELLAQEEEKWAQGNLREIRNIQNAVDTPETQGSDKSVTELLYTDAARMHDVSPDDPNFMDDHKSRISSDHYQSRQAARSWREGVIPLFAELNAALERGQDRSGPTGER